MTNMKELAFTLRSNDVSEMTFKVYKTMNEITFPEYDMVRKMRLVHVDGLGYFVIQEINEVFEGEVPYKEVTLYSAEYMLNYKPVNLALITMVSGSTTTFAKSYKFYDDEFPEDTLMYRLFAGADFKDWTFDYDNIPDSIKGKYRSFDDSGDGLYGFLQNYVSTSYDCVFTYDIENYIVSVHKKDDLVRPTDITLSMDNLMKKAELKELADEISTVLSVKGSDKLSLSKVNPNGTNNIYKFDYYLKEEWIGDDFLVSSVTFDKDGNVIYNSATGRPVLTTMNFTEHVKLWEEKIKEIINSANTVGSYGYLLTAYTYLNMQYNIISAYHTQAEYIYNYCTEAIATYKEETKEQKRSVWGSILFGVGLAVLAVAGVTLAIASGGTSLIASASAAASALAGGSAAAVAAATGATGIVGTLASVAATTAFTAGVATAFQGLFQLGALAYQTNITKEQMKKYQEVAQKNMDTYKSGGAYVYNLTADTLTNLVTGRNNEFVVGEPLLWISKTYTGSTLDDVCQKRPKDTDVQETVGQKYCLDVLEKKLNYINEKLNEYNKIYAYKNWFSELEQQILQPFLIQSEYSDESFTATDDIDVDDAQDVTKYITTTEGTMTIEEYRSATDGFLIKYICKGDVVNYKATPMKFNQTEFRNWLVQQNDYRDKANDPRNVDGSFYILYDGQVWGISDNKTGKLINNVFAGNDKYPNGCGITADTHDGKYTYKPVSGDYMLLKLYSDKIILVDTLTVATQLAQQAYDVLDECSQPAFSFSVEANNFTLLPEYKEWTEQLGFDGDGLTLGSMINVVYVDDQILNPFVQEVSYEYDNPDSLSFTFGNKFNLGTSEYTLGKIFSNNTSTVQRVQRALIGTSSVNGGSGSNSGRNNSGAIGSNSDAIDAIAGEGGLLDKKIADAAMEQAKKFNDEIKRQNDARDEQIALDLANLNKELNENIASTESKVKELMDNNSASFATTIGGGLGLHITQINDGSGTRYCFHNGETMNTSNIYYYFNSNGFAWTKFTYTTIEYDHSSYLWWMFPIYVEKPLNGMLNKRSILYYTGWSYGMTGDGDMVMRQLTVDNITAKQIAANSINATHIVANSISGDKLVANTITGDKIRADTIYASNLREDAWCKLIWTNPSPSTGIDKNFTIQPTGVNSLNNFTAAMIYCSESQQSALVLRGCIATMTSMAPRATSYTGSTGHLFGTISYGGTYDTYASREVLFNISGNNHYLSFSDNQIWQFGHFRGSKDDGLFEDGVSVSITPKFYKDNRFNIPAYVYGLRWGVRATDTLP